MAAGRKRAAAAKPIVGFLCFGSAETSAHLVAAFRRGLGETGYVENQNVTIEFRWAQNQSDLLPEWQLIWRAGTCLNRTFRR